ncbi:MAG: alpha/beta hydrolase family protein [Rikenellaceae bacterium]
MKKIYLSLTLMILTSLGQSLFAAKVDSVMVHSLSMDKNLDCRVITPDCYTEGERYPVVYLLHGYGGDAKGWVNKYNTRELCDQYSCIIVAVDGGFSSWYWDSPVDDSMKFETFVAHELVEFIDQNYKTIADRSARAVTGLSMGGQGAMYLSIRNQEVYGAVCSMSGGLDIRPFPERWDMAQRLGTIEERPENWEDFAVINQLDRLQADSLAIYFDCGVDDFFYEGNVAFHEALTERKIAHTFTSSPGAHTLQYWRNSLPYHFLFFDTFFKKSKTN